MSLALLYHTLKIHYNFKTKNKTRGYCRSFNRITKQGFEINMWPKSSLSLIFLWSVCSVVKICHFLSHCLLAFPPRPLFWFCIVSMLFHQCYVNTVMQRPRKQDDEVTTSDLETPQMQTKYHEAGFTCRLNWSRDTRQRCSDTARLLETSSSCAWSRIFEEVDVRGC